MVEYIGGKKKNKGSRGSISAIHNNQMELDSVVFNNRVKIYELATLADFLISQGQYPRSGGDVLKMSLLVFYQYLISTGKGKVFELNEAKMFVQRRGLDTGSRRNVKVIGEKLEEYTKPNTPEQTEEINKAIAWFKFKDAEKSKGIEANYEEWLVKWLADRVKAKKVEYPSGFVVDTEPEEVTEDLTIPKDTDQLLTELEKGAPNVVQTQGGEDET